MRHRWAIIPVAVLLIASGVIIWTNLHSRQPKAQQGQVPPAKSISIGVIMPLSGNVATIGQPCANGMQLAIDEYNGKKRPTEPAIKLISEDTLAKPKDAIGAFTKLVTADHVVAVLGPLTSGEALAVAPIANENRVVLLSPGASTPDLTQAGEYVFRNELSDSVGGLRQAQLARNTLGYSRIAALYMNNDYGLGLFNVFQKQFVAAGGQIVAAEAYPPDTVDFRTVLARLVKAHPDALFVVGIDELVNVIEQARALGIQLPIYTTPIFENKSYLEKLGKQANGILYVYYGTFDSKQPTGAAKAFIDRYTDRFRQPPTYYSALGYDAANLLIEGLRINRFQSTGLAGALYAIHDYAGVTGRSSFDKNGDIDKPVTLKTVRDGQFVPY
ncbi:MAG TPA: penicillin-binding protein activator [Thermoanaerobaculia bacterium]|jgi:branched-chain amino acid transport system substrate-binding protein